VGLNTALVDKARVLSKATSSDRVEGTTVYESAVSAWFRARLELGPGAGSGAEATGAQQSVRNPSLMCGIKDSVGELIVINGQDRLEVQSGNLGHNTFDVVGDPAPIRKKRKVIGWTVTLRRADIHPTSGLW
jgi:hypothetical protein